MYLTLIGETLKALTLSSKHQNIVEQLISEIDFEQLGIKSHLFENVKIQDDEKFENKN